jgi:hypothetical protein
VIHNDTRSTKYQIVNCNDLVIQYKEHLWCTVVYLIIFVLLRTLRFIGTETCELTEELGGWLYKY